MTAAVIGPISIGAPVTPIVLVYYSSATVFAYDLGLFAVGVLVITLAALAMGEESVAKAYASGFLSLLMFEFFFIGTALGALSLVLISIRRNRPEGLDRLTSTP